MESQQNLQQEMANQEQQRAFRDWQNQKRSLLYVGETDTLTPLGKLVNQRLNSGRISRSLSWVEQAEDALDWAVAKSKPNPEKREINLKGKHQATPASGKPHKMSPDDFFKKYGDRLADWAAYNNTGKLPEGN